MNLVFVGHGESEGNAEKRLQGHANFGLSEDRPDHSQSLYERFQNVYGSTI
jgi:broad specificity phosphatase PhoE